MTGSYLFHQIPSHLSHFSIVKSPSPADSSGSRIKVSPTIIAITWLVYDIAGVLFQGVSPDSLIDVGVQIGEKVNVKKSCIGQHCLIGEKSKLINCILMDHVTVAEG